MAKIIKALEHLIADTPQPPKKKLKILMIAAEAAPYATVGGFSSVVAYLSKELKNRGHDIRVFIPKFGSIDEDKYDIKMVKKGLRVPTGNGGGDNGNEKKYLICNVKCSEYTGVPVYLLENREYYELRANVYGYSDDPTRFALLSKGALEFIKTGDFVPDVIHSNDWHTGIIANYIKTVYKNDKVLSEIPVLFTIHNMAMQGIFDHRNVSELDYDDGHSEVASLFDPRLAKQNFLKRGVIYSDGINTVSKAYSKEILTSEFGEGMEKLLMEVRSKLFGIINGLDYKEYNPATDELIEQNYDINSLDLRTANKAALQKEFDLPVRPDVPLLGYVGRLSWQKGVDLMTKTLEHVMYDFDVQFVQVGGGDGGITQILHEIRDKFPDKIGVHTYLNFTLSRLLFAGCDMFLLPSRFEPCGIVQIEAMRYGAIPIVRKVGGLADTVENYDSGNGKGTGFVFTEFNEFSLFAQIVRALEIYKNKNAWKKLMINAMKQDFSWEFSAREYEKLYARTMSLQEKKNPLDPVSQHNL